MTPGRGGVGGGEDPLEEKIASHSNAGRILAGRISWTEEHGRTQPTGSQRVGYH